MKAIIVVAIIALLLITSINQIASAQQMATQTVFAYGQIGTPVQNGKLYVEGNTIRDEFGNPIRMQGFNTEEQDLTAESIQWLKANGFNSIRMMIWWHRYEPTQNAYSTTYLNMLDNVINLCQANGIYVNLCFHQWQWSPYFSYADGSGVGFPSWLISAGGYENSAAGATQCATDFYMNQGYGVTMRQKYWSFWQMLINRYKNNSCVWAYEIMNEPTVIKSASFTTATLNGIMSFYESITTQMRAIDSNTIIIYHYINFNPNPSNYNAGVERAVPYPNIVWTRSWYDVAYGGYTQSELGQLQTRLTNIKNKFNGACGTPFIISEMGLLQSDFPLGTEASASAWIRDSFNTMRNIDLNNGYEAYSWYVYDLGPSHGFWTSRNADGTNTFITPVLKEYNPQ